MMKFVYKLTVLLSILAMLAGLVIPTGETGLQPLGAVLLYICPVLGLLGLFFAIKQRTIFWAALNILCILAFPISWWLTDTLNSMMTYTTEAIVTEVNGQTSIVKDTITGETYALRNTILEEGETVLITHGGVIVEPDPDHQSPLEFYTVYEIKTVEEPE